MRGTLSVLVLASIAGCAHASVRRGVSAMDDLDRAVLEGRWQPLLPDAADLGVDAPSSAAVPRALLVCHVTVEMESPQHVSWDIFGTPDPLVELDVGAYSRSSEADDTVVADMTFSGVPLQRGDHLRVIVADADVGRAEWIATMDTTFAGTFPIVLSDGPTNTHVRCRLGDSARAEREAAESLAAAEPLVAELEHASLSTGRTDLGWPRQTEHDAAHAVALVMGYVGNDDPRALALRDRLRIAQEAHRAYVATAVTHALAAHTSEADLGGVRVRVERVLDDESARAAGYETGSTIVELSVTPMPADPNDALGTARWLDDTGEGAEPGSFVSSPAQPSRIGVELASSTLTLDHVALSLGADGAGALLAPR